MTRFLSTFVSAKVAKPRLPRPVSTTDGAVAAAVLSQGCYLPWLLTCP